MAALDWDSELNMACGETIALRRGTDTKISHKFLFIFWTKVKVHVWKKL